MKKKVCIMSHGLSNNGIDIFVRNVVTRLYRFVMRFLAELFANRKFACSEPAMVYLFGEN